MHTLIIGGGLSGLAVAHGLAAAGHSFTLVEARDRFGGRIQTERCGAGYFDLGPAWFWPGQPRIAALIDRLALEKFDQYSAGDLVFEDAQGRVQRGRGFASMEGSWRLKGGLGTLTQTLAEQLPTSHLLLNAKVTSLTKTDGTITATLSCGKTLAADRVVLALPPRIAAQISFSPKLPAAAVQSMLGVSTWMAGQAKALAVYDTPFWREAGLSGDATSRFGPMVEIHDASPATGGPYGVFGFIGVPPQGRANQQALRQHIIAQLTRLFGDQAATPTQLFVKDWAFDPQTSIGADLQPLTSHPTYGMPPTLTDLWANTVIFAGTEVAPQFGGYLEGALEAAENALLALAP
ncbi:flavin monoamine oxidase family protein [Pseudorhodobacter sp. W20_MBD10_FR17]|uniref:flavin monoamine oxidase family protein n=1 Tax=Pseudorhodobacter sp. W20_MBD10_FR17 TaxID=3240266 RepID=UPI003F945C87